MITYAKKWIKEHESFVNYFLISCFVTVLDIVTSRLVEKLLFSLSLVNQAKAALIGNACGVVLGFVVQYFLCTKKVYAGSNAKTLLVFFLTWLLGLGFAEGIIYVIRTLIFNDADRMLYFLIAKAFSIALPFFLTYFLRKIFIPQKQTDEQKEDVQ